MARKPRPNATEERFEQKARSKGWDTTKKGWPDFICFHPDGRIVCVEVKPRATRRPVFQQLTYSQLRVMTLLQSHGIECLVSDGVVTERFDVKKHGPQRKRNRQAWKAIMIPKAQRK